ncbi:hypothetical protein Tco_1534050 [Tanacetum coccineum]
MMMFLSPVLLLGIIVVSVAVLVVVVFTGHVDCLMQGRRLRRNHISFDSFQETHECTFQSSCFQWASIQDTSELSHGILAFAVSLDIICLSESESRGSCSIFSFRLLGSIQWSS